MTGRTLGLVGLGAIGIELARIAAALGMRIIAYDPVFPAADRLGGVAVSSVSLEALIETADVISLHCPLTEATRLTWEAPGPRGGLGVTEPPKRAGSATVDGLARPP